MTFIQHGFTAELKRIDEETVIISDLTGLGGDSSERTERLPQYIEFLQGVQKKLDEVNAPREIQWTIEGRLNAVMINKYKFIELCREMEVKPGEQIIKLKNEYQITIGTSTFTWWGE